ncbi:MAG: methyltransferase domain-containing protein [Gammaproteobacteria bacterium]|nr:methyltransferase domain-containing protein [Gammaproteobacteria bacterium]
MYLNKFTIFPAIHLRNGEVVRFTGGDTRQPIVFNTDPVACAQQWIDEGAEWLQVVNLDAAFNEEADNNWELIQQMARLEVDIQFGGGIGSMKDMHECFDKEGIDGVIVGKALYTGNVDLKEALRVCGRKESFEAGLSKWKADQLMPWNRIGYELIEHNLKKHIPVDSRPLRILDAGGGNGLASLTLARMNHQVDLVDLSRKMLDDARAKAALAGVTDRLRTHANDILGIADQFTENEFDIVLCHNVIQFVDDVIPLLQVLHRVLKPDGFLSLVTSNQHALPYQAAFAEQDLDKAFELLDPSEQHNPVFDIVAHEYRPDEVIAWLTEMGLELEKHYGIRCLYDFWGSAEDKDDPGVYEKLKKLEMELTERAPYKLTARQFQLIARKS